MVMNNIKKCSVKLILKLLVGRKCLGVEVGEGDGRHKKSSGRAMPERKSKSSSDRQNSCQ